MSSSNTTQLIDSDIVDNGQARTMTYVVATHFGINESIHERLVVSASGGKATKNGNNIPPLDQFGDIFAPFVCLSFVQFPQQRNADICKNVDWVDNYS
jgi:hypothetical protein